MSSDIASISLASECKTAFDFKYFKRYSLFLPHQHYKRLLTIINSCARKRKKFNADYQWRSYGCILQNDACTVIAFFCKNKYTPGSHVTQNEVELNSLWIYDKINHKIINFDNLDEYDLSAFAHINISLDNIY